ncbi:hypothetical protein [Streptacidiphilus fuscans]|uniref:Uncharacterized protein n=1 Tax=Streptacidiphilus fuscans TaxID=2789292 RepID=A0A931B5U4_9ACTN|nr:hypothetical protein [Streptacidiphilus fuscans]MBF9067440.1 hypothetical protein [Streptacidiphilus fuscans]
MMYDLLLTGPLDAESLRTALERTFAVPVDQVDVSAADDPDRRWEAAVSCGYEPVLGDVSWHLEVITDEDVVIGQPTETEVARAVADALGRSVLFPAEPFPPSAYWLAAPGGPTVRARLYDEDPDEDSGEEGTRYLIDAVAAPVPDLPDVRVEAQPEVIREHRMLTPVADAFTGESPSPSVQQAGLLLAAWESFTVRMASGWPPDGWYPADYFAEDLETRDRLGRALMDLAPETSERLSSAIDRIDETYREGTAQDNGAALAEALSLPRVELALRGWWWQRSPQPLPWPEQLR